MPLTLAAPNTKDALICESRTLTYNELIARAQVLALELRQVPGDQVVVFSENSLEWAVIAYAIWASGKVLVPIDAQSTAEDVAYVLRDCEAARVYSSQETRAVAEQAVGCLDGQSIEARDLQGVLDAPVNESSIEPIVVHDEAKLATIIYTSGTTGEPKGAMLTFANLHANLRVVLEVGYFPPDERVLLLLPLHHVLPLMGCLVGPLAAGATSILCPSLARDDVVRTLSEQRITMLIGVPRFFELLGKAISDKLEASIVGRSLYSLASKVGSRSFSARLFSKVHRGFGGHIRYFICGGAPLDPNVAELFKNLGFRMCEGYGMTECAPLISFPRPDEAKPGACGKPVPGAKVELRDGEIVVQGPQVMRGYFNRPSETAEILRDGWLYTGDLGHFDEDGHLKITGRKKEILILPNGKNVNPHLSEVMLESHPEISEAGVFLHDGVLHGLIVVNPEAIPKTESDVESLIWSQVVTDYNQRVAPYRQLSRISVVTEPLPRTRLGKLRRHLLRAPDQEDPGIEQQDPWTETEQALIRYLLKMCPSVLPSNRLGADLGVDSMARLELRQFIQKTWSAGLDEAELTDRLRVSELATLVDQRADGESDVGDVDWAEILSDGDEETLPQTSTLHLGLLIAMRIGSRVWTRLRVAGASNVFDGPKIFAPNHQSALDGVFVTAALPLAQARNVFFLAKEVHMRHPLVRFLAKRSRIIVLEQSDGLLVSLKAVASALRQGHSVVVFPEGTRSVTGDLGDFKQSYAVVAKHLDVQVVPIALRGAREALPKGSVMPRLGRKVHVDFLPTQPASGSASALNDAVRQAIAEKLDS